MPFNSPIWRLHLFLTEHHNADRLIMQWEPHTYDDGISNKTNTRFSSAFICVLHSLEYDIEIPFSTEY